MQVPAYCPILDGVQLTKKRGVVWILKKVIIIEDMGIIVESEDEDIDMTMVPSLRRKTKVGESVYC